MQYLAIILMIIASNSCRSVGGLRSSSELLSSPTAGVLFQRPDCLPNCTAEDQARLQKSSEIESAYIAAIRSAKQSIEFSQFTFSRKPIFDELVEAAKRGVRIRGIVDRAQLKTTGGFCQPTGCALPLPFSDASYVSAPIGIRLNIAQNEASFKNGSMSDRLVILLTALPNGVGVRPAPGKERLVHNKFAIIDGTVLLSGSGNWSSTATSINLENLTKFDDVSGGDVVQAFACMFDVVWTGDPNVISKNLSSCQVPGKVYFSPVSRPGTGPQDAIISAIGRAGASIDIAMHHLVDPEVIESLIAARKKSVTVRVTVDDDDCNMKEESLSKLESAGIAVKYIPTSCKIFQLSHNKFGVFDKSSVINGSGNWSKSGLAKNYENFITSSELASAFSDNFEWLWGNGLEKNQCQCDRTLPECIQRYCLNEHR